MMRDYDESLDRFSFLYLLSEFWKEFHKEDVNKIITVGGYSVNYLDAKLMQYQREGCFIKVWEEESRLIGFCVYQVLYDCVMVIRAIYWQKPFRQKALFKSFIEPFIKNGLKKMYGLTYESYDLYRQNRTKRIISSKNGMDVWEFDF